MTNIQNVQKTVVFRALQLGDLLCSIPAIRALKLANPNMDITLIGLPWAKSFVSRFNHYFNGFISFPGYAGLPEQPFDAAEFALFMQEMKANKIDLLLQMQGNGTIVNPLLESFGATYLAGFDPMESKVSAHASLLRYPNEGHEIDRHLALMSSLGISEAGTFLEFPIYEQDIVEYKQLALPLEAGKYVCIHAGSRGAWRQWPPHYFADIADYCSALGYAVVLTGTADELQIVQEVAALMKYKSLIVAGKTTLGSLAVLIREAAAIVCNCTGVAHMASALETPAVVISMDGEPWRWAPKDAVLHRCIDWTREPEYELVQLAVSSVLVRS